MSSKKKRRKKRKSRNQGVSAAQPLINGSRNHVDRQTSAKSQVTPSASADEIKRLISKGKTKAAVSKAKQYHKRLGTDQSEMVLVEAYAARIREMIARGFLVEAKTLLELIGERYKSPDLLVAELNGMIAIREGRIDELVRPLDDPNIPPEVRQTTERIIKRELVDLNLLVESNAISSGHPLKTGAAAILEAFTRVTAGSVQDEEIVLAAISRRNPLAPWKMLIKAIYYFYRHEDEKCETYLQAVDLESAPGRMVPLLRNMMAGATGGNHGSKSSLLVENVTGNRRKTGDSLRMLDIALAANKPGKLFKAIRGAVKVCGQTRPEVVDKLKQHISIKTWLAGMDAEDVNRAMGGSSLKNAYFWLLYARAAESKDHHLLASALLAEFRKHALHEGWFVENKQEDSAIFLYMADLLKQLPAEDFEWLRSEFEREFGGFDFYYQDQPQSIAEAVQKNSDSRFDTYFLYPELLYQLASKTNPTADTFQQWLGWVESSASHWKEGDAVAIAWHAAFPDDARPLLYLMKSAEKRNALKKALGYLDTAERIDGLNPDVKKARLRLLVAAAVRHLKQKKTHLARKDIAAIELLPHSQNGDQPAFAVALTSICAMIDGDESELLRLSRELTTRLGYPLTAKIVLQGLLRNCGLSDRQASLPEFSGDSLEADELAAAVARGCQIGDDMGIGVAIPPAYERKLTDFFGTDTSSSDGALIKVIAETALRNAKYELAYAAAGAGLLQQSVAPARFLLLRARSLPPWEMDRREDCITAAIELARRERDLDLIDEAIELRRNGNGFQHLFALLGSMIDKENTSMETEELNQVLERERTSRAYPSAEIDDFFYDVDDDDDRNPSDCRYCDAKNCPDREAPYVPGGLEFESGDEDHNGDDFRDFNGILDDVAADLPPELTYLIKKVFTKHGKNGPFPPQEEVMRKDPWLADQLLREIQRANADGILPQIDPNWMPGWLPRF